MRDSEQDRHYVEVEADAFFTRNHPRPDPHRLRPAKRAIAEVIEDCGIKPTRVLEYGCNYGDLLQHYASRGAEAHGVEPSRKAVEFGLDAYGEAVRLYHGTLAENPVNANPELRGSFDLVVIDDVFCWVSRETLFQSIANVDDALAEGGYLFIREFFPLANSKNRNHHVEGADVYCFKPAAPHYRIFTASGIYATVWEKVWMDRQDSWVSENRDPFESRWVDSLLRKSFHDYYRG